MNIVLLSGGSGKRLWPLSNEIRSKQFVKIFKENKNLYRSMVQRVYRQITTVDAEANITIATSKSQVSALHNQLGDNVSICVEPCRRDTFPAVALVSTYLKYVKHVSENEYVVVCPVDPYVDTDYFEAVNSLGDVLETTNANLALLGIEPTYPSEKYGYIIPKDKTLVSDVVSFKEKPDVNIAKEYIREGALWNAGVFAFKLEYMLKKAHSLIDFTDYNDLLEKYDSLEKISFDYAVVEKEKCISVKRFDGSWKDVGTWNTLSEVMSEPTKGNVMLADSCENTNVVNELDIPILCLGCKDMIIAASSDGILVSDKGQSSYMKPLVDKLEGEARYAEKSWGSYTVVDASEKSLTIKIELNAGNRMKYHSHEHRDEVWTVVSGEGRAVIDGVTQKVYPGSVMSLKANTKHTLIADTNMRVVEVQIGDDLTIKDKKTYKTI